VWTWRSLPLNPDKSKLEFSGTVKMKRDSDETIAVYGNADHLDPEGGRCGEVGKEVCRKHDISDTTFYRWKSNYGGMSASTLKRLRNAIKQGELEVHFQPKLNLHTRTVDSAEGVESDVQLQHLFDADCDYIQGYLVAKAMGEADFVNTLVSWQANARQGQVNPIDLAAPHSANF
jgi:transposase-like protein